MLYVFDFQYLLGGLSELKILVSVVRFRPGPPRFYEPPSGGLLLLSPETW